MRDERRVDLANGVPIHTIEEVVPFDLVGVQTVLGMGHHSVRRNSLLRSNIRVTLSIRRTF